MADGWARMLNQSPPESVFGVPKESIMKSLVLVSWTSWRCDAPLPAGTVKTTGSRGFTASRPVVSTYSVTGTTTVPREAPVTRLLTEIEILLWLAPVGTPAGSTDTLRKPSVAPLPWSIAVSHGAFDVAV